MLTNKEIEERRKLSQRDIDIKKGMLERRVKAKNLENRVFTEKSFLGLLSEIEEDIKKYFDEILKEAYKENSKFHGTLLHMKVRKSFFDLLTIKINEHYGSSYQENTITLFSSKELWKKWGLESKFRKMIVDSR